MISSRGWRSFSFFTLCSGGIVAYYYKELSKKGTKLQPSSLHGEPKIGGHFGSLNGENGLIDSFNLGSKSHGSGARITSEDEFDSSKFKKFMLVYFGFTHCPDVCPEELERIGLIKEKIKDVEAVFVTIDPKRDTKEVLKDYLLDFSPSIHGITGPMDSIAKVARKYRVYFKPSRTSEQGGDDYLLDHSIFLFLVDPNGKYVAHYGKDLSADECASRIREAVDNWNFLQGGTLINQN